MVKKGYPTNDPGPGHVWVVCTTCNGTGEIISGWSLGADSKKIRCPSCFRLGWVEAPIRDAKRKPSERKEEPSEEAKRTAQSVIEWLKTSTEEEKPAADPPKGGKDKKKQGYGRRRRPIWANMPSERSSTPSSQPPAPTVDLSEGGRRSSPKKRYPARDPLPGYVWVPCAMCDQKGEILSPRGASEGREKIRCPRCFRLGWVQLSEDVLRKSHPQTCSCAACVGKRMDAEAEAEDGQVSPRDSAECEIADSSTSEEEFAKSEGSEDRIEVEESLEEDEPGGEDADWSATGLEGIGSGDAEPSKGGEGEKWRRKPIWADLPSERGSTPSGQPPDSQTGGKSDRDIHGANCDCEGCQSLRKAYGQPRRRGRFPGRSPLNKPSQSSLPQGPAKGGKGKKSKNKRRRRRQRKQQRKALNYCVKHPKMQTALACGKCGRFICHRCITHTPVGMRCGDCAAGRGSAGRGGGRRGLVVVVLLILAAVAVAMYYFIVSDGGREYEGDSPTAVAETQTTSPTVRPAETSAAYMPTPEPAPVVEQEYIVNSGCAGTFTARLALRPGCK